MAILQRTLLAEDGIAKIRTEALGDNTGQFGTADIGMLVKLAANSCVPCADGDDIYGQVKSVESATVNDGYSYGSVKQSHRIQVKVGPNQVGNMAVGDLVVADAQPAFGAGTGPVGLAKTGTPTIHKWQCISVSGTGAAGDTAILEKV